MKPTQSTSKIFGSSSTWSTSGRLTDVESKVCKLQSAVTDLSANVVGDRQAIMGDRQLLKQLEKRLEMLERKVGLESNDNDRLTLVTCDFEDRTSTGDLKHLPSRASNMQLKPNPDNAVEVTEEDEEDEEHFLMNYEIGGTLWDAPIIVGLQRSRFAAGALMSCMILNACLQLYMTIVLFNGSSFIKTEYWDIAKANAAKWRENEAHNFAEVDASGRSLATRVCGGDSTLSVAGKQVSTLTEIHSYLSLDFSDTNPSWTTMQGTGPLLCSVCILMYVVVVLKELRNLWTGLLAVWAIPSGPTTVENGRFIFFSRRRLLLCFGMAVIRAFVACALLYVGTNWLAFTSSPTELILNAAALSWIMDLDELLYETMVPAESQKYIENLEPMRYWRPHFHMEAIAPAAAMVGFTVFAVMHLVIPESMKMYEVRQIMCQQPLNFYAETNPAGYVVIRSNATPTVSLENPELRQVKVKAILEMMDEQARAQSKAHFSMNTTSEATFSRQRQQTLLSLSESAFCANLDTFNGGSIMREFPVWFTSIRYQIPDSPDVGLDLDQKPFNCSDYQDYCLESGLLRNVCPITCGCPDPTSKHLKREPYMGCPTKCGQLAIEATVNQPCEDLVHAPGQNSTTDPEIKVKWDGWWDNYLATVTSLFPHMKGNTQYTQLFIGAQKLFGCTNLSDRVDPAAGHDFCDEDALFLKSVGIGTLKGFCPQTCCRGANQPAGCPASCSGN